MKKWLVVALGLLLAVPNVASAKTVRLAWGTWSGGSNGTTFTSTMGDSGTAFFNGTNSSNYTSAISTKDMSFAPFRLFDANNTWVGNPIMKIVVTGTPKGSWGNLAARVQKSVDGYVWEPMSVHTVVLVASTVSSLAGQTYSGCLDLETIAGDYSHPIGYYRLQIYNDGTYAAKLTGAKCYVAYEEDDRYEQVVKPGKWVVDANTVKDTTSILGFTGRDTTAAFDISDIAPVNLSFVQGAVDTTDAMGAFFVLRQPSTTLTVFSDSIYVTTDVSYDGGTTWAGNREMLAGINFNGNSLGTTFGYFNGQGGEVVPIALTVLNPNTTAFGTATGRSAFWLFGATHVRFRVAATAGKALPTFKPYIVYWRKKG